MDNKDTVLKDVGQHVQWGTGHYEAEVKANGNVIITTIYDTEKTQRPTVSLSRTEWDRLVAWVEWQRRK